MQNLFINNGVMTTPKRRILSFVFTVLCFKKSFFDKMRFVAYLHNSDESEVSKENSF